MKSIPSRYTGLPFGAYAYGYAISVAKNHFGVITMVTPPMVLREVVRHTLEELMTFAEVQSSQVSIDEADHGAFEVSVEEPL